MEQHLEANYPHTCLCHEATWFNTDLKC